MFEAEENNNTAPQGKGEKSNIKNIFIFGGFVAALLIFILVAFFLMFQMNEEEKRSKEDKDNDKATSTKEEKRLGEAKLPGEAEEGTSTEEKISDVEAEKLNFGQFYNKRSMISTSSFSTYELPLNVKTEVANYHDVARKIDLDGHIEDLNNNGFAVVENPFSEEADNFYNLYRRLGRERVAPLVTSDFLLYYYQNNLKRDFKKIEHNIFYDNLWDINKKLYQISKTRYQKRRREVGVSNDPLLEAERLETVFFATALKLLEPTEDQIAAKGEQTKEEEKFSQTESYKFSVNLPSYLREQVKQEVEYIREGKKEYSSPVLLYDRDYKEDFQVPRRYQDTARLNNFYLTTQWLNSPFPLYYKGKKCPDCLLDKEDWRINMITTFLLSKDFSDNQLLENKWARIYKIISFFKGLREDLTYLEYADVLEEELGEGRDLDKAFSSYDKADDTLNKLQEDLGQYNFSSLEVASVSYPPSRLEKLQEDLGQYNFSSLEGGYDTEATSTLPRQGLKVMTESYWPNDYIFEQLTYPYVRNYKATSTVQLEEKNNITACELDKGFYRCRGFGLDVVNLVHSIPEENKYFVENTNYFDYPDQSQLLKQELKDFNSYKWHSSNYWSLMDILDRYLSGSEIDKPPFTSTKAWQERKLDTSLGAWTNLQLDKDTWSTYQTRRQDSSLSDYTSSGVNNYTYVEPNLSLINELLSNSEMLLEMFNSLKITDEAVSVQTDMERMIKRFERVKELMEKELKGEQLSEEDHEFLHKLLRQYEVNEKGDKVKKIEFGGLRGRTLESIDGVELLVLTHKKKDKIFFSVGPVFDYEESYDR